MQPSVSLKSGTDGKVGDGVAYFDKEGSIITGIIEVVDDLSYLVFVIKKEDKDGCVWGFRSRQLKKTCVITYRD